MRLEEGIEFVQAAILLRDTILQPRYRTEERVWRSEDQSWRREDRQWRGEDMEWREEEQRFMNNQKQWRLHDLEQRSLDNARVIWGRFMEKNRRDVEERAEQLKSLGNLAALVAGFAVVAFLEFGDDEDFENNPALTLCFGITAALVVGLNMNVMVASSLLHASILRSGKLYVNEAAEAEFMQQCLAFVTQFQAGMDPPAPSRTFEKHWDSRCEQDWRWAFMLFVSGLVCFALNLVLATWIKFSDMSTRIVVTTLLSLSLVFVGRLLAFWAPHLFSRRPWSDDALRAHVLQLGNDTGLPFAWHRVPRPADVPREAADSNFQDADSRFVYVDNTSNTGSDSSTGLPPVATAFSTMSQTVHNQDFQDASTDTQSLKSAAVSQENPNSSVPNNTNPANDRIEGRNVREGERAASNRLNRTSNAHCSSGGVSRHIHPTVANVGTDCDSGLRTGSWRSLSQSPSRTPRPKVQDRLEVPVQAASGYAGAVPGGDIGVHSTQAARQRSPNRPRAIAEGRISSSSCCEGCSHQYRRMQQDPVLSASAHCCRSEVYDVYNRGRAYSEDSCQRFQPTRDGQGGSRGAGRWGGRHVHCAGHITSSNGT